MLTQVWYGRADELDGAGPIGRDLMIDLRIGKLLGRTEQPVTRIADSNVVWSHSVLTRYRSAIQIAIHIIINSVAYRAVPAPC